MTTIFEPDDPPNPFMDALFPLLTTSLDAAKVSSILYAVNAGLRPWMEHWNLWDAFFNMVVHSPTHAQHFAFIRDVRAHPPTQPTTNKKSAPLQWSDLPGFARQWSEVHGCVEARRDWVGSVRLVEDSPSTAYATIYERYCAFSASLLKTMGPAGGVPPIRVFYEARNTLERDVPLGNDRVEGRSPARDVWDLDVRVAATWIRDGAGRLWDADVQTLREGWRWDADAQRLRDGWGQILDSPTDLWPRTDGLTLERWQFWLQRLRALGGREGLGEETKRVLSQAAQVVETVVGPEDEKTGDNA